MTVDSTTHAVETIQRHHTDDASLLDVARALEASGSLHEMVKADDLARSMEANHMPDTVCLQTEEGIVRFVFTSEDTAHVCAEQRGIVGPGEASATLARPWLQALRSFLNAGDVGIVIDDGAEHRLYLDGSETTHLFTLMSIEEFARHEALYAVCTQDRIVRVRQTEEGRHIACAFESEHDVARAQAFLERRFPGTGISPVSTISVVEMLVENGVDLLMVNPGLGDERDFTLDSMKLVLACASQRG